MDCSSLSPSFGTSCANSGESSTVCTRDDTNTGSGRSVTSVPVSAAHIPLSSDSSSTSVEDKKQCVSPVLLNQRMAHIQTVQKTQYELEKEITQLLNEKWVREKIDTFLRCLDNEAYARQENVLISFRSEKTDGNFVCIAPPDSNIPPEDLKEYIDLVKEVMVKQKDYFDNRPIDFDSQIQALGQQLKLLAEQRGITDYSFEKVLKKLQAQPQKFEWRDPDLGVTVKMNSGDTGQEQDEEVNSKEMQEHLRKVVLRQQQSDTSEQHDSGDP